MGNCTVSLYLAGHSESSQVKKSRKKIVKSVELSNCVVHRYRSDRVAQYMAEFPNRKYIGWVDSKMFGESNISTGGKNSCTFTSNDGGAYIVTEEITENE